MFQASRHPVPGVRLHGNSIAGKTSRDLVSDSDVLVDFNTLIDVESLVDDYTEQIDEALDAEFDDLDPRDGVSSDELIDQAR